MDPSTSPVPEEPDSRPADRQLDCQPIGGLRLPARPNTVTLPPGWDSTTIHLQDNVWLHVIPRRVMSWDDFRQIAPPSSIALDGAVFGKPAFDPDGPWLNLNHHEEVDRLGTRATCAQAYISLKQGLLESFRADDSQPIHLFVNDPDHDVCTAVWVLANHQKVTEPNQSWRITRLVNMEDLLDTTAGAFPHNPDATIMKQLAWTFEPYTSARASGALQSMSAAEMGALIEEVCGRITMHVEGRGLEIELDTAFDTLIEGSGWAMIAEHGAHARTALFTSGVSAFVSVQDLGNGLHKYSIGKMSPFIRFPLERIYDALNEAEGVGPNDSDRWGGGDTIGGSPRSSHSKLSPATVAAIVEAVLKNDPTTVN